MSAWRKKQAQDYAYRQAKKHGYRARSAYKLIEIQQKFHLISKESSVLDLGCAPGGWLQVATEYTHGFIAGIDLQPVDPIERVHLACLDFMDTSSVDQFLDYVNAPKKFDVILSDMSPIITGDRESDHYKSIELLEAVYEFAKLRLNKSGYMVCKLFDGQATKEALHNICSTMTIKSFKPRSSRQESRELYLIGNLRAS